MPSSEMSTAALSCLPMVRTVAARLHRKCPTGTVDKDDLVQEGMLEIIAFCERYDSSLGVPLDSAAHARAKGAMLDYLRSSDNLSRDERRDYKRVRETEALFAAPDDESTALVSGLTLERVRHVKRLARERSVTSLNEPASPSVATERIHLVPCEHKGPLQAAMQSESRTILNAAIGKLSDRDNTLLRLRYVEDSTFEEIAAILGITPDGAAKAHAAALCRLRSLLHTATRPAVGVRASNGLRLTPSSAAFATQHSVSPQETLCAKARLT